MRVLVLGVCASLFALVAAAIFMAVSLSARTDTRATGNRNVTIEGGGCPADSSVLATTGDERLGSTRADRAGNFRFTVSMPDADRSSLVSTACGTIAFTLSEPARATTGGGRSIAVMSFLAGVIILVAALVVLLRRRLAMIDLRDSGPIAPAVPTSDDSDRELSEVSDRLRG